MNPLLEPLLKAAPGVVLFGVRIWFWLRLLLRPTPRYPFPAWPLAAEACHLAPLGGDAWVARGEGKEADLRVRFQTWSVGTNVHGTRVFIDAPDRWIVSLGLSREGLATERAKERGAREIETGDDAFDDAFYVTGPETAVRAVLDDATRRLLLGLLVEVDLEIVNGQLRGQVAYGGGVVSLHARLLSRTLPVLFDAARRLRRPSDIVARLAHNARTDRSDRARRENLLCLARDYPDAETTRETIRAACTDPSSEVRVRAAVALGEEGRPVLLALVRDPDEDDLPTARALATLGDRLATDEVGTLLGHALRAHRMETARECLLRLGRHGDEGAVAAIAKVMAVDRGPLAVAAAQALAKSGRPEAEAPLLAALAHGSPELRREAATALGRVGSPASVLALKDIESRDADDATRRAARQAVAAIQSRLPGASAGQLSLASTDAGALSLAEDESGRLSLDQPRKP